MFRLQWGPLAWTLLHIVLLLSIFSPLSMITMWILMAPIVISFVKTPLSRFLAFYLVGLLLLLFLLKGIGLMSVTLSLFFLPAAIVMGILYKKTASARTVLISGTLTLLAQLLLTLMMTSLLGIKIVDELRHKVTEGLTMLPDSVKERFISEEAQAYTIYVVTHSLPLYFICFSVFFAVGTHFLTRKILNHGGAEIPGLQPVREWMLPKSLVWYFMIGLLLNIVTGVQQDTIVSVVLLNLIPLLTLAFSVQAVAFLCYVAYVKKWNWTLPIVGIVGALFFPFLLSILGVLDVAFSIRQRITLNK